MQTKILQKMKRVLCTTLLFLLLCAVGMAKAYAYDFSAICSTGQTLYYNIIDADNHYVELTCPGASTYSGCWSGFTRPIGAITLPESVQNDDVCYIVISVGNYAFCGCNGLTGSLTIPSSVTTIGSDAFYGCSGISGVYYMGDIDQWCSISFEGSYSNPLYYAHNLFINNELLVELSIPETITTIKPAAFCRATCINTLTIPNSVIEIGADAFSGCSGITGNLIIPYSVIEIGADAFSGCSGITGNLIIPNSVTAIGGGAFGNCSGFTGDLTIPNSVTTIGRSTFYNCSGFTGILTIPSSITTINEYAFTNCGFTEVHYNATNCADFSNNYAYPFSGCSGILIIGDNVERIPANIFYNAAFSGVLTIGNSVTTIGSSAFYNCNGFTGVNYTGSITQWCSIDFVGSNPLRYAHNLFINNELITNLVIPETVTMIKPYSFIGATCLTSLTISNSVVSIGNSAFENCSGFTSNLTIPNSVVSIGNSAFGNCSGFIGNLIIPNSVVSIGDYAFSGCSGFYGSLTIPNPMTSIGNGVFRNCSGLTGTLVIPETITLIGNETFRGCSGFTGNLIIPNSVVSIGDYAFSGCSGFTGSLTIPNSVTSIGSSSFYGCTGFSGSLTIPTTVTTIGYSAFSNDSGFTDVYYNAENCGDADSSYPPFQGCSGSLHIGENVVRIPRYMFRRGAFTGNLIIPISVTSIGYSAFSQCSGFTGSLTIPDSVTELGGYAFAGCSGFSGCLSISNALTEIGASSFSNCSGFKGDLIIPNTVNTIGSYAFEWCNGFTGSLTIGNSVTSIGVSAFYSCDGFNSINLLPETPPSIGSGAFSYVPKTNPVYVPCDAIDAYQSSTGWNVFTNMTGLCSGEVVVTIKPSEGGTVTGSGYYTGGTICELSATSNAGFSFGNWMENGRVISVDTVCSFYARPTSIVANFCSNDPIVFADAIVKSVCVTNWDTNGDGELSYKEAAMVTDLGEVFRGNSSITSFNELQYFINLTAIGSYAFYYCYGMTSVIIPSSVTTIGNRAFYYCHGLTSIVSFAEIPPTVGTYAFRYVNSDTPVTVPCGKISAYQSASGWSQFTNIQEICHETNLSDEICQGEDYLQNGFEIFHPEVGENQYSITLPSSQGLDSIVNLTLTVHPTYYYTEDTTLCNASSFTWRGHTYTESGIYYDSLQTIHGCDSIYQLSLDLFNTPLGEFTYMTPTNNYPFTSLPITFSWDAVLGAEYYDLYMWDENDPIPNAPYASNLTNRYYSTTSLSNYHTYNWYVTARNTCYETSSSVKSFYLDIIPSLDVNVTQINFGEVAMNGSTTTTVSVTGIVLEDELNVEITGDDSSMFSFTQASGWNNYNGGILIVSFNPTTPQYSYNANLVVSSGTIMKTVSLTGAVSNLYTFNTYVAEDVYAMNSQIPIYGSVTDWNNAPVADAEVEIGVFVMGMKRTLQAMTNASGQFSAVFEPMPTESGYYTVNSGRVGNHSTAVHDDFNIPGMALVSSDYILCAVTQDLPKTDSILIRNKSNLPLNNIQLSILSAPDGCSFLSSPMNLAGLEEDYLVYTVTGSTLTQGNYYEEVRLKATSSEGAETSITIWYYCMEPRGVLDVAPKSLVNTMTKGKIKIVDVMLTNNGTAATGNITIDLPDVEWMSIVGNDTLPSLAVNDTAYFSLRFSPDNDIPLVQYSGTIAINSERGDAIGLPYTITAVADSTGTLVIDVTDDYTWNTNNGNGPHLEGAEVTLKGYYTLETMAQGYTDSDGIFQVNDLPEGYYWLSVSAERHYEHNSVVFVEAGATDRSHTDVYLQYQAVTYSWIVEQTEIQDEYTYELNVMFETNVPVPVVVIEAPKKLPEFDETYMFDYVITNHGLINAENLELHVPISDDYLFTPLFNHIDTLHALTTVVVPCVVTHNNGERSLRDCAEWGYTWTEYTYKCHRIDGTLEVKTMSGFVYTLLGNHPCEPPTELAGSGSGGGFAAPLFGIVGGHGFPNPFIRSPFLEMWYECDNGCANIVLWGIGKGLSKLPLIGTLYSVGKTILTIASAGDRGGEDVLNMTYDYYSELSKQMSALDRALPLGTVAKCAELLKDIKDMKNNIIHCYHYLSTWRDDDPYMIEVPFEVREMLQYMDVYAKAADDVVHILNMYYNDTTWFDSDIYELDAFMDKVFEYDSIYGRVYPDSSLLSLKPSNISDDQVVSFADRYNNTLDLNNGIIINSDNYIAIDSIIMRFISILNVEDEAVLLGYESGADRLMHLINEAYDYIEGTKSSSVCAKVTIQFSQKMTMTREAFEGTFIVHNGHDTDAMTEIGLNLVVKDEDGNDCTDLFQINTTSLENLTGIEGSGSLEAGLDGIAKLMFIPTKNAAPTEPKIYYFGGTFTYVDPFYFDLVTIDLYPVKITVHPSCNLKVDYFMQRTILGDDALTEDVVEPSVPAELGVIINNKGAGMAKNVLLETAEPQIIDNEKGLAINFGLYDASFNGSPRQLGLHNISFGNIESGHTAVGEWRFTSSLLGHFISYNANVIHNSSYGNPDLSLVSHLDIHELIHPIYAYGNLDDGINDFLVNDIPDAYDTPDSIYFSHGGKTSVGVVDGISYDHLVSPSDTVVTLTVVPSRIGWNYGVTDDPGMNQYDIVSCIRNNDNQVIPLNNVWLTFVTIPDGGDPVYENKLHIVDTLAVQQTTTYTLVFAKKPSSLRIFNGNVDVYWTNAENWEGNIIPQVDDEVLINGICQLDEDVEVFSLTVAENQSLTIPAGRILTTSGTLTSEATSRLVIQDGGQLVHKNVGVQATVQKDIEPYTNNYDGYYLVATPLAGFTAPASVVNMLSNDYDLYYFDQSQELEWINYEGANGNYELVPGKGYLYANSEGVVLEFAGELRSGATTLTVPLIYTEGAGFIGFNLVGNPFVYNLTTYASHNVAEGCYRMNEAKDDLMVSEISESNPLKPAEGFFVKATDEGAYITFNPQMTSMPPRGSINVELSDNGLLIDRLIVKTDEGRSLEKFNLKATRSKLFAHDKRHEYAIVPCESHEQPVSFKAAKNGTYTVNVNADGMEFYYLHLIDNLTGNDVNLLAEPSYTFEARTTDYASRFLLRFIPKDGPSTGSGTENFAYNFNGTWIIANEGEATLQVVDLMGHILSSERISGCCEKYIKTAAGVYLLRLINGDDVKVQKIVVN